MGRLVAVALALALSGCSTAATSVQCKTVKVSYWQDKAEPTDGYKYKVSYQCTLPDGATSTVTPIVSKGRIPGPKCK